MLKYLLKNLALTALGIGLIAFVGGDFFLFLMLVLVIAAMFGGSS